MNLQAVGGFLGILGAIIQVIGYAFYIRSIAINGVIPNIASWSLWSLGSIVTLVVYSDITGDWSKIALPVACAVSSAFILVLALRSRLGIGLDPTDWLIVVADLIVVFIWLAIPEPIWAYTALLIDTSLTFVPMIRAIMAGQTSERPTPWVIWTVAYSCMLGASFARWEGIYPVLLPFLLLILHGIVACLSFRSTNTAYAEKSGQS